MEARHEQITKIIREQIKNYEARLEQSETGVVILVGDGIARAAGLDNCMAGELLEFPNGAYGMAQNLEEDAVSIVVLGNDQGIQEGDTVKRTGRVVSVPVGEGLIGRVVDALGQPIEWHVYPMPHAVHPQEIEDIQSFLIRVFSPAAPGSREPLPV